MNADRKALAVQARQSDERSGSKVATRMIAAHVPEPLYEKIRQIARRDHTTIQAVVSEAVNQLLADKNIEPYPFQRAQTGRPRKVNIQP